MRQFRDKVAVITGAGSGIGRGMARVFAGEGMDVVIGDIELGPAEETACDEQPATMAITNPVSSLGIGTGPSLPAEMAQSTMVWLCSRRNCAT